MINSSPKPGRRGPRLALAIALGAAAAAGVFMYANSIQQQAAQNTRVAVQAAQAQAVQSNRAKIVVAKQTLPAQTALTADNVELHDFSSDAVEPNAETAIADVVGKAP